MQDSNTNTTTGPSAKLSSTMMAKPSGTNTIEYATLWIAPTPYKDALCEAVFYCSERCDQPWVGWFPLPWLTQLPIHVIMVIPIWQNK